jgi:hypothetical protein
MVAVTQSTPAITPAVVPLPLQSSTRIGESFTALATPQVVPPVVPATWVPWPLQSLALPPLVIASNPPTSRPEKSAWSRRIPVSMM